MKTDEELFLHYASILMPNAVLAVDHEDSLGQTELNAAFDFVSSAVRRHRERFPAAAQIEDEACTDRGAWGLQRCVLKRAHEGQHRFPVQCGNTEAGHASAPCGKDMGHADAHCHVLRSTEPASHDPNAEVFRACLYCGEPCTSGGTMHEKCWYKDRAANGGPSAQERIEQLRSKYERPAASPEEDPHSGPHQAKIKCAVPHPRYDQVQCDREKGHGLEHRFGTESRVKYSWSDSWCAMPDPHGGGICFLNKGHVGHHSGTNEGNAVMGGEVRSWRVSASPPPIAAPTTTVQAPPTGELQVPAPVASELSSIDDAVRTAVNNERYWLLSQLESNSVMIKRMIDVRIVESYPAEVTMKLNWEKPF